MSSTKKPQPPNLDLIAMVQNARMQHDDHVIPSKVNSIYWIEAKPDTATHTPTAHTLEIRVTTSVQAVDALWERVKAATHAGELGYKSKVSTCPTEPGQPQDARTIVICTYDATDTDHVQRVADHVRQLGIADEAVTFAAMNARERHIKGPQE